MIWIKRQAACIAARRGTAVVALQAGDLQGIVPHSKQLKSTCTSKPSDTLSKGLILGGGKIAHLLFKVTAGWVGSFFCIQMRFPYNSVQ